MSSDAQFIVVTHNRRTMEMAQVLYGVTMQEPGVSKLVSVSWDQARATAASNAA
jgi:chromosome segregation protein